jgi:hypothetical protein
MIRQRPHRPETHRRRRRGRPGDADAPQAEPRVASVFRRDDDTVCHGRCRQPLVLQGIRGLLEADFYCYTCLAHVTVPLTVLRGLLLDEPRGTAAAALSA